jgi:dienelactone hydrolase
VGTPPDAGLPLGDGSAPPTPPIGDGDPAKPADGDDATPDGDGAGDGSPPDDGPITGPFLPVDDLAAAGPYAGRTINGTGPNGGYTIFAPEELAPEGHKNPVVAWGNGGSTTPSFYTLLPHLATHGFVVIASNTPPSIGGEVAVGEELTAGIDWILAENERSGSEFYDKLDGSKIAAMGYSMGSLGTFQMLDDPRLTTTVHISGGNMGDNAALVGDMHAPAAFICGENDIAYENCNNDFAAVTTQAVWYGVFLGGDHLGILFPPYEQRIRMAATGWLRWQLMRDQSKKPLFVGEPCELCQDTANWRVMQKNLQ